MQWGSTIVDSLDTLLLLELPEEFAHARKHVREVDFGAQVSSRLVSLSSSLSRFCGSTTGIISGIDWGRNGDTSGRRTVSIHAFETVIRCVEEGLDATRFFPRDR